MSKTLKLSKIIENEIYFVTKGTKCGTLQKGDRIRVEKGDLINKNAGGWLVKGDWENLDAEIISANMMIDGSGI
jgi:hypothetical protein